LVLDNTSANDDSLKALSQLTDLEELYLRDTEITDAGLQYLADAVRLRVLQICGTAVSDRGIAHLGRLKPLRRLDIRGLDVTDAALESLADLRLETLLVQNTQITLEGLLKWAGVNRDDLSELFGRPEVSAPMTVGEALRDRRFPLLRYQSRLPKLELNSDEPLGAKF
jgi:hypothetical protein